MSLLHCRHPGVWKNIQRAQDSVGSFVFSSRSIKFLGHKIDVEGIKPDPKKVEAITKYPRSETTRQVRAFLGMASFYRKFIQNFSKIARPLHDLTKKGADVMRDLTSDQEEAFYVLKDKFSPGPYSRRRNLSVGTVYGRECQRSRCRFDVSEV